MTIISVAIELHYTTTDVNIDVPCPVHAGYGTCPNVVGEFLRTGNPIKLCRHIFSLVGLFLSVGGITRCAELAAEQVFRDVPCLPDWGMYQPEVSGEAAYCFVMAVLPYLIKIVMTFHF